jgi:peptide chain release factor 2
VSSEGFFDLDAKEQRVAKLEQAMAAPGFWSDQEHARGVVADVRVLKQWIDPYTDLRSRADDAVELATLEADDADAELVSQLDDEASALEGQLAELELRTMLQGPDDHRNALLTVHAGAGGTESQDWVEMLVRMYTRWAQRRGYDIAVLDLVEGEEAGVKSAAVEVRGQYAYGFLKAEKGVHRLVRISPFDAQARRHTSFASVFVYPEVDDDIEVDVREDDLRIDTFRASGAGGQHVNKTSSAVRITHLPSGIVVSCQQERSQFKNKATAMKMLRARLYERAIEEREAERQKLDEQKTDISWGNQIRSYVFQPYTMVNDHRTEVKVSNVQRVMDGDLDPFIEAYLKRFGGRAA